jgi:hypothetical protein
MLAPVRRLRRAVACLLGLLSPAAGGTLLPAIDPCPVDMPWMVQAAASAEHAGHHDGSSATPAPSHDGHSVCHCIGACTGATTAPLPAPAAALVSAEGSFDQSPISARVDWFGLPRPRYVLPPSHAPPVA